MSSSVEWSRCDRAGIGPPLQRQVAVADHLGRKEEVVARIASAAFRLLDERGRERLAERKAIRALGISGENLGRGENAAPHRNFVQVAVQSGPAAVPILQGGVLAEGQNAVRDPGAEARADAAGVVRNAHGANLCAITVERGIPAPLPGIHDLMPGAVENGRVGVPGIEVFPLSAGSIHVPLELLAFKAVLPCEHPTYVAPGAPVFVGRDGHVGIALAVLRALCARSPNPDLEREIVRGRCGISKPHRLFRGGSIIRQTDKSAIAHAAVRQQCRVVHAIPAAPAGRIVKESLKGA